MLGHVTSSYYSPTLGRSIALALVKGGAQRIGERVHVSMRDGRIVDRDHRQPGVLRPESGASKCLKPCIATPRPARASVRRPAASRPGPGRRLARRPDHRQPARQRRRRGVPRRPPHARSASTLPLQPCTSVAEDGALRIVWAGPDDWFVIGPAGEADAVGDRLRGALAGLHHAVTDVSSGYTVLQLSGRAGARRAGPGLPARPAPARVRARARAPARTSSRPRSGCGRHDRRRLRTAGAPQLHGLLSG